MLNLFRLLGQFLKIRRQVRTVAEVFDSVDTGDGGIVSDIRKKADKVRDNLDMVPIPDPEDTGSVNADN